MSLLREIQNLAVDNKTDISVLLRKCKVLSSRLGNEDFKKWVESELNGYSSIDELPDYRILRVHSQGHFIGFAGKQLKNADIPLAWLPDIAEEQLGHSYLMQPISSYIALIEKSDGTSLEEIWPPDFVAMIAQRIYQDMNLMSAWKVIPYNSLVSMVESVRNKILSFALEIEGENPDAGEAPINSKPIADEKVTQIFHTYISGDVQNLAAGNTSVTQHAEINVHNDLDQLINILKKYNVPEQDLNELREAVKEDKKDNPEQNKIGSRVTSWMTKMISKSANGVWKVGTDVAATVISKAICSYYGLQ